MIFVTRCPRKHDELIGGNALFVMLFMTSLSYHTYQAFPGWRGEVTDAG